MATDSQPPSKRLKFLPTEVKPLRRKNRTISLLPAEQLLRRLLLDCRNDLAADDESTKLEIRFTGGWVRDKLLGQESPDIDVALSTMTGFQFGTALKDFVSRKGAAYQLEAQELGVPSEWKNLHKIEANPEKSKHLETTTTRIFGLDVDLVNLRREIYTANNRNPRMEFGTAKEDALRRDATVNAMFYNLDKEEVEDLTGKGLDDMNAGIIRTPLEPHQTFTDDPLRVLRLIRFASRLGYYIDDSTKQSMANPQIHKALRGMISRERVGTEVTKMMNGPNPLMAFELIHELNLYSTVFLDPKADSQEELGHVLPESDSGTSWPRTWPHAYKLMVPLLNGTSSLSNVLIEGEEEPANYWTLVAYAPVAGLVEKSVTAKDAREGIRVTNKVSKILEDSLKHLQAIREMAQQITEQGDRLDRSTVGKAIRSWGTTWRLQVLYSLLAEAVYQPSENGGFAEEIDRYTKFVEFVQQQKLQDAAVLRPILNGEDVKALLEIKEIGPFMKTVIDAVVQWQFDHADGSKEEAKQWLLTQRETLAIPS